MNAADNRRVLNYQLMSKGGYFYKHLASPPSHALRTAGLRAHLLR